MPATPRRAASTYRTAQPHFLLKIDVLAAAYQAGAAVDILATHFGIHRATVGKYLQT